MKAQYAHTLSPNIYTRSEAVYARGLSGQRGTQSLDRLNFFVGASSVTTPSPSGIGGIGSFSPCEALVEWLGETRQLGPVDSSEYL